MTHKRVYTFSLNGEIGWTSLGTREANGFDTNLRAIGITNRQLALLFALERNKDATIAEIARELALDRATVKRHLTPMISTLVVEAAPASRGRDTAFTLTQMGSRRLQTGLKIWKSGARAWRAATEGAAASAVASAAK